MKCKNFDNLSPEDKIKIEEIEYRRGLCRLHGFGIGEYNKISRIDKDKLREKLEKEVNKL